MARRHLQRHELSALLDVLAANGLGACSHPDCDPRQPSCATNAVFLRAKRAVVEAYRLGQGRLSFQMEDRKARKR